MKSFDTYDLSTPIGRSAFDRLLCAARHIEAGQRRKAEALLSPLLETHTGARHLQTLIFVKALLRNISEEKAEAANLYLQKFDLPQIELFDLLARDVPLVNLSGQIVNGMICDFLARSGDYVLLDVGMGSGRQEIKLLDEMAARGLRKLTLVGIEPAVEVLREAEQAIRHKAETLGIAVEIHPIGKKIEDFDAEDWAFLGRFKGKLIINEAFSLHHVVQCELDDDLKDRVMERLCGLEPAFFVLTEPHSDHETSSLSQRLVEAWSHFGLTFAFLDQLPNLSEHQKAALKSRFFAREIEDILQNNNSLRVERHEKAEQWLSRLEKAKFRPMDLSDFVRNLNLPAASPLNVSVRQNYVGLDFSGSTIVSIIGVQAAA
jgi:hypothetical protein